MKVGGEGFQLAFEEIGGWCHTIFSDVFSAFADNFSWKIFSPSWYTHNTGLVKTVGNLDGPLYYNDFFLPFNCPQIT